MNKIDYTILVYINSSIRSLNGIRNEYSSYFLRISIYNAIRNLKRKKLIQNCGQGRYEITQLGKELINEKKEK